MNKLDFIYKIEPRARGFEVISLQNLQIMLRSSKGAKIITLVTLTVPDLRKSINNGKDIIENPYFPCFKISRVNGMVNFNYENAVNNQLVSEGKEPIFESQPRKWGVRLTDMPFISHLTQKGEHNLYLEMRVLRSLGHFYWSEEEISQEKIEPFLKKKSSSKETQGVDGEIIVRDYDVKNILTLVIGGTGYLIQENTE